MSKYDKKILKLPVNTFEKFIKEKKINYQDYCILLSYSNYQYGNENEFDLEDNHRYLYKEKFIANEEEIEKLSNRKMNTITRNVNKIIKLSDNQMITVCRTNEDKIVYIVPKGDRYVLIEQEVLRTLCELNSNVIKTYLFFKWKLRDGEKIISRKEICKNIGLSINSDNNLKSVSHIVNVLVGCRLIKTVKTWNEKESKNSILYKLCSYREFIDNYNKNTKGLKD